MFWRAAFDYPPSIVELAKTYGRPVLHAACIQRRADFIERHPLPQKFDVGTNPTPADSRHSNQLPAGHGHVEIAGIRVAIGDQIVKGVDPNGSKRDLPTGWRDDVRRASMGRASDPAMALQHQILGGNIVFVRNGA